MFWTFKVFQKRCFGYSCFVQCPEGQDGGVYGGGPPFIRWKAAIIAWAQPIRRSGKFCRCPPLVKIFWLRTLNDATVFLCFKTGNIKYVYSVSSEGRKRIDSFQPAEKNERRWCNVWAAFCNDLKLKAISKKISSGRSQPEKKFFGWYLYFKIITFCLRFAHKNKWKFTYLKCMESAINLFLQIFLRARKTKFLFLFLKSLVNIIKESSKQLRSTQNFRVLQS